MTTLSIPCTDSFQPSSSSSSSTTKDVSPFPGKPSRYQRIHRSLGFQKPYNLPLFIILAGALFGFSLARLSYLNIAGSAPSSYANSASPGEWYWSSHGIHRVGITLHLYTVIPAGLLMIWQFLPIIRHKLLLFHRINGYVVVVLVLLSNVGALMIARRAFGGSLATQGGVGVLAIVTTTSIVLAYYNIKRLQVDQHRAWMLRAMLYMGTIVTMRLIMIISALIISKLPDYNTIMTCGELGSMYDSVQEMYSFYPQCGLEESTADTLVIVKATFGNGQVEQIGASLRMSFGMALWMALFLHAVGVEIYLGLTPRESNRLRQVSYERQMERGLTPFGSAGLTSDRCGDAEPWRPAEEMKVAEPAKEVKVADPAKERTAAHWPSERKYFT
ncbi:MAG: hypothetical protein Q9174_003210 [Haloplaca sp. 1 TL-2023]